MNRLHQALFGIWLAGAAVAGPLPKLASGSIQRIELSLRGSWNREP